MYYYDLYGWLTPVPLPDRATKVAPPEETESLRANWTGESWVLREYVAPPLAPSSPTVPRHITVGAFFDRFGPLKWEILADPSPQVQAVICDASVRNYIDLDAADLPAGLALLQAAGHAIDPDAIIDAPIHAGEWP
jgi:hypothetical protein